MASKNRKNKSGQPQRPSSGDRSKQPTVLRRSRNQMSSHALTWLIAAIVSLLAVGWGFGQISKHLDTQGTQNETEQGEDSGSSGAAPQPQVDINSGPRLSLEQIQAQKLIVDVHEHIQSLEYAAIYLSVMDELGIGKMCLMGSSKFTLTLNEKFGFTEYDQNNEELIKIIKKYPGRFEAWPCVDPKDPQKLDKFKDLVARGATGLKLYVGHGFVTKKHEYMFHTVAMDDPGLLPLYAFCQENFIPVCIHVNPYYNGEKNDGKPGFAEELIAVLTQFPDMKVDVPHFILSSVKDSRLREYLDTFPNLYTDVSFGDSFAEARLKYISKNPNKFRKLFSDYPDRIMFATDLVLTPRGSKTRDWVHDEFQAYLDMLSTSTYTTPIIRGETLHGLALSDLLLNRVLYQNYQDFIAKRPQGTKITRKINWSRMGVTPVKRAPGQAFPPPKPQKK